MKWIPDPTGRFAERPFFTNDELEAECARLVDGFYRSKYRRRFAPPWDTEDLKTLLEGNVRELDLYADLRGLHGDDVEGATTFEPGEEPVTEIEATLTNDERRENRLRTTITHEQTHVLLHRAVWEIHWQQQSVSLFDGHGGARCGVCRRETILGAPSQDWMEWQAGYGSGAILMLKDSMVEVVRDYRKANAKVGAIRQGSEDERRLVDMVMNRFQVSEDAARVRLRVLEASVRGAAPELWD